MEWNGACHVRQWYQICGTIPLLAVSGSCLQLLKLLLPALNESWAWLFLTGSTARMILV
jgi:hypothetical protein